MSIFFTDTRKCGNIKGRLHVIKKHNSGPYVHPHFNMHKQ